MQHQLTPMASMPPMPAAPITSEQIQKYLDENKQLILAILENQNLGKLAECAQYQALLQKNLLYLAAIADAQPQGSGVRPQMIPQGAIAPGAMTPGYMQQSPIFPTRAPLHLSPHQLQDQAQAQHQTPGIPFAGQMGIRPGIVNGMHNLQAEPSHGSAGDRQGNKHGTGAASDATAVVGHRSAGTEHGSSGEADQTSKTP